MDRKQLETKIERETYKFMNIVKESASDMVMLWARRNKVDIDTNLLMKILDQYKVSLESEWMAKIDMLMGKLDAGLEEFTQEENPMHPTRPRGRPRKDAE